MNTKAQLILIALFYLVIRYGFTHQLEGTKSDYVTYYFELLCVISALVVSYRNFLNELKFPKAAFYGMALSLAAGAGVFKLATPLGLEIPFQFNSLEILFFLLIVAPVLEELIFRWLLWKPIETVAKKPFVALIVCALVFSYSHFHPLVFIVFIPNELRDFIYYQTAYTFLLGLGCGYYVYRYASLSAAIAIHFAFNLGFYLASFI